MPSTLKNCEMVPSFLTVCPQGITLSMLHAVRLRPLCLDKKIIDFGTDVLCLHSANAPLLAMIEFTKCMFFYRTNVHLLHMHHSTELQRLLMLHTTQQGIITCLAQPISSIHFASFSRYINYLNFTTVIRLHQ